MMSSARRAISGSTFYAAAMGLEAVVQVTVLSRVTRAVPVATYAQFALLLVALPFVLVLINLGVGGAAIREAAGAPAPEDRRRVLATMMAARLLGASALAVAVVAGAALPWSAMVGPDTPGALGALAAALWGWALFDAAADALRARERHTAVAVAMAARTVIRAGLTVGLVVLGGGGLRALLWAHASAHLVAIAIQLPALAEEARARPSLASYRSMLRFGWPLAVSFGVSTLVALDGYAVKALASLEDAGFYQLAGVPSIAVTLAVRVAQLATEPYLYGAHATADVEAARRAGTLDRVVRLSGMFFVAGGAFLSLAGPELVRLLAPPAYAPAVPILPWLTFAATAMALFAFVGMGAGIARRTFPWAASGLGGLAVTVALALLLPSSWGVTRFAFARFAGAVAGMLLCYALAYRVWPLRLPVPRVAAYLVAAAGVSVALTSAPLWARAAAFLLVLAAGWPALGGRELWAFMSAARSAPRPSPGGGP